MGKPSRSALIAAWCSAAVGAGLMLATALLPAHLVVPAIVASLVLIVVGAAAGFLIHLWRGG